MSVSNVNELITVYLTTASALIVKQNMPF